MRFIQTTDGWSLCNLQKCVDQCVLFPAKLSEYFQEVQQNLGFRKTMTTLLKPIMEKY